jgi:phosphotriesterase-related protein
MLASDRTGKIQTVLGLIEPESLGITLTHEHALIDLSCYFQMPEEATERWYIDYPVTMGIRGNIGKRWRHNRDSALQIDEKHQTDEVYKYYLAGGNSFVDATSIGIGRDPLALARMSRATGLNIIMGASYYVPASYHADMGEKSEQQMTDQIIGDITVGVKDTGVKSGIIGEVGNFWPTNETSQKVLRASAHASVETGAAILIHPGFHPDALSHHLNDLIKAGADPSRIIMGHLDIFSNMDVVKEIAETGVNLEYDKFGTEDTGLGAARDQPLIFPSDAQRMQRIEQLIEWGYENQIVIAHDVCFKTDLPSHGGKGYSHILESIVPRMRKHGFSTENIDNILIENPKRILTFR